MKTKDTTISLKIGNDLLKEFDQIVGTNKRSAMIRELIILFISDKKARGEW